MKTLKFASEINWPLAEKDDELLFLPTSQLFFKKCQNYRIKKTILTSETLQVPAFCGKPCRQFGASHIFATSISNYYALKYCTKYLAINSFEKMNYPTAVDNWVNVGSYFIPLHFKVHIFWEGHRILRNLHLTFDWHYIGQN